MATIGTTTAEKYAADRLGMAMINLHAKAKESWQTLKRQKKAGP